MIAYHKILFVTVLVLTSSGCMSNFFATDTVSNTDNKQTLAGETEDACITAIAQNKKILLEQQQYIEKKLAGFQTTLEASKQVEARPALEQFICAGAQVSPMAAESVVADETIKQLVGATETIRFDDLDMHLPARIDTGIITAILNVNEIKRFERNGERWVTFSLTDPETETTVEFSRQIQRVLSAPKGVEGAERRPVVALRFTLGDITQQIGFALISNSSSKYPVSLGRQALRDVMLVDVGRNNVALLKPRSVPENETP